MKLRITLGPYILSVIFAGFIETSSFELPKESSSIAGVNEKSEFAAREWAPPPDQNVAKNHSEEYQLPALLNEKDEHLHHGHVVFYFFTKTNPNQPQILTIGLAENLGFIDFRANRKTVFITHGLNNTDDLKSCTIICDAYLAGTEPVNVIIADWRSFRTELDDDDSETKVKTIGDEIARMIEFLRSSEVLELSETTLIGHGLGAHIMGVAGRGPNGKVHQIFGLDPTPSMYRRRSNRARLSKLSAKNVQVIHTNGNQLGLMRPIGHSDFYPNGGSKQPGCAALDLSTGGACSHERSFYLFAESLNSSVGFRALKCRRGENPEKGQCRGSTGLMGGLYRRINEVGLFYLETGSTSPFAYVLRVKTREKRINYE